MTTTKPPFFKWFPSPTRRAPRRKRKFWLVTGGPYSTKKKAQTRAKNIAKRLATPNFSRVFKNKSGWWAYHADTGCRTKSR